MTKKTAKEKRFEKYIFSNTADTMPPPEPTVSRELFNARLKEDLGLIRRKGPW